LGPGGQWLGAGGSERERGSGGVRALTGGPGSIVPPGSVLNRFKQFKTVQTDLNLLKLWPTQKVPSRTPKIGNKIWWKELEMRNNFA
jgi:hypothetical protein